MQTKYNIGESCWIFAGEKSATQSSTTQSSTTQSSTTQSSTTQSSTGGFDILSKGKVVDILITPYRALPQYVILLDDPDFLTLELRDVYLMSNRPDKLPVYVGRWQERGRARMKATSLQAGPIQVPPKTH